MAIDTLETVTPDTATPDTTAPAAPPARSRRAILAGALGGLGGLFASRLGAPGPAAAAAGDPLIIGNTTNTAGTANTTLTTASAGTALLVTQNGSGTALRGSAVGPGSIAGFFTANNGTGVSGVTGNPASYGVFGSNDGAAGAGGAIRADGNQNNGLNATTDSATKVAIKASSTALNGTVALFENISGGVGTNSGPALRAYTGGGSNADVHPGDSYVDAAGEFAGPNGVIGGSESSGYGVLGLSSDGSAVAGFSTSGYGVEGFSASGDAILGVSTSGNAGTFTGPVFVSGLLTKAGGGFKVDHPEAPASRYLQHSFVESPDMKNVYDGVATLDPAGEAHVELPDYFETLNRDPRYQLTPVGAFSPLYVKTKLAKGAFVIAGGAPGQEVSWQVTGIRKDPWAETHRLIVEPSKTGKERGTYLHPELYGQPAEKALGYRSPNRA